MRFLTLHLFNVLILIFVLHDIVNGIPTKRTSLVLTSENHRLKREIIDSTEAEIKSLHVNCDISMRYANTTITSIIQNKANSAKEVTFSVILPDTAFISGFIMKLDNKEYEAYVKEKEEAKRIYDEAVSAGETAAHVKTEARDSNYFTVSINLESSKEAEFRLKYEELLMKKNGMYEMAMNINPGQLIDEMSVVINIDEVNPISYVKVPLLSSSNEVEDFETAHKTDNPFTTTKISEDRFSAKVHFAPSKAEQIELMEIFKRKRQESNQDAGVTDVEAQNAVNKGISGQFVIQYDVELDNVEGQVLVNSGYFVHFFNPENLEPLNKYVVFVLDVSGSMSGQKITQLKSAMMSILDQLKPGDDFNIVTFSSSSSIKTIDDDETNTPIKVTPQNIASAKTIINEIHAGGGTNMEAGLKSALNLIMAIRPKKNDIAATEAPSQKLSKMPLIIFLSDGQPNIGKRSQQLISFTKQTNEMRTPIFSLAFGRGADRDLLKKISLNNFGFMRPIYDATDASKQLKNFFKIISSPLLLNVEYKYPKDQIEETTITERRFHNFFLGSLMVVAGKYKKPYLDDIHEYQVLGQSRTGLITFHPTVKRYENKILPMERIWAYLTIKQLLDEKERNEEGATEINRKALELGLKYKFVTPLTSLVVVKPNSTVVTDPSSDNNDDGVASVGVVFKSYRKKSHKKIVRGDHRYERPTALESISYDTDDRIIGGNSSPLQPFGLENFSWIEQYLDSSSNVINLPFKSGLKTLKLKQSWETLPNMDIQNCTNAIGGGNLGKCRYLTDCGNINRGFKSLAAYEKHFCALKNGYAGICCKN